MSLSLLVMVLFLAIYDAYVIDYDRRDRPLEFSNATGKLRVLIPNGASDNECQFSKAQKFDQYDGDTKVWMNVFNVTDNDAQRIYGSRMIVFYKLNASYDDFEVPFLDTQDFYQHIGTYDDLSSMIYCDVCYRCLFIGDGANGRKDYYTRLINDIEKELENEPACHTQKCPLVTMDESTKRKEIRANVNRWWKRLLMYD